MSLTKEMAKALEEEARKRKLGSIQETMRAILSDYFIIKDSEKGRKQPKLIELEDRNPLAH